MASLKLKINLFLISVISLAHQSLSAIESVAGDKISLPCGTTAENWDEYEVLLVLWYKESSAQIPIYKVDSRTSPLSLAKHTLPDDQSMAKRFHFDLYSLPPQLIINPVVTEDAGKYRCRVDYRSERTQSTIVDLNVIEPPHEVIIKDSDGHTLNGIIGPYDEYTNVFLICEAKGYPIPSLIWYHTSILEVILDDSYIEAEKGLARNELNLRKLDRKDFMSVLTCRASSHRSLKPKSASVMIDMNLRPLNAVITAPREPLIEGRRTQFRCSSDGSRPEAHIVWQIESQNITQDSVINSVINNGNTTFSIMSFIPQSGDNGKHLKCIANNIAMPFSSLIVKNLLNIHFAPKIVLSVLNVTVSNNYAHVIESNTITLECSLKANPEVKEILWFCNGKQLVVTSVMNVLMSYHLLVIQSANKNNTGKYECSASNSLGNTTSESINLVIQFAPICKTAQKRHYDVQRNRVNEFRCDVEAEPSNNLRFLWYFNTSSDMSEIKSFRTVNMTTSIATLTPRNVHYNYAQLMCFAENSVAKQTEPCIYRLLIQNGPPESVKSCMITNHSLSALIISCTAGDSGGLNQRFFVETYLSVSTQRLHSNLTSIQPLFTIGGIKSDLQYTVKIYSFNEKGRSNSVVISYSPQVKRIIKEKGNRKLFSFIGIVTSIVIMAILCVIIIKIKVRLLDIKNDSFGEKQKTIAVDDIIEVNGSQLIAQSSSPIEEKQEFDIKRVIANMNTRLDSLKRLTNRIRQTNYKSYELEPSDENERSEPLLSHTKPKKQVDFVESVDICGESNDSAVKAVMKRAVKQSLNNI